MLFREAEVARLLRVGGEGGALCVTDIVGGGAVAICFGDDRLGDTVAQGIVTELQVGFPALRRACDATHLACGRPLDGGNLLRLVGNQ